MEEKTFSDVSPAPPTTTSRPTTVSGSGSTGINVCFVDLMYTYHIFIPSVWPQDDGPSKYVQNLTLPKGQQDCTCYKSKIYSQLRLEL